jgi:hypothetical protein
MRIKLATPLLGEFPRYSNVKLPDNGAVTVRVEVDIWDSEQSRKDCPSEHNFHDTHVFPIERELSSDNPLDYAYKMLEQSGLYPDATWNV